MTRRRDVLGATTAATAGAPLGVRPGSGISDGETRHEGPAHPFERD